MICINNWSSEVFKGVWLKYFLEYDPAFCHHNLFSPLLWLSSDKNLALGGVHTHFPVIHLFFFFLAIIASIVFMKLWVECINSTIVCGS